MKKNLIDESQKNEILKRHEDLKKSLSESVVKKIEDFKKILSEQAEPIFIDNRTVEKVKTDCTNPNVKSVITIFKGRPAIKVVGGPDNIKVYTNEPNTALGGYNWYVLNTAETRILKGPLKWTCPAKQDPNVAQDIEREIASGLWKKRDEINVPESELTQLYEKHPTLPLYKLKVEQGKQGGFTPEQLGWINTWTGQTDASGVVNGQVYKITLTPEEQASQAFIEIIAPGSERIFPKPGLKVYYNPQSLSTTKNDKSVIAGILKNETVDREACRKNVADFYTAFTRRNSITIPVQELDRAKRVVQSCKDAYYNKWGILGGGKKLDHYIDVLSGTVSGGAAQDTPWRLK